MLGVGWPPATTVAPATVTTSCPVIFGWTSRLPEPSSGTIRTLPRRPTRPMRCPVTRGPQISGDPVVEMMTINFSLLAIVALKTEGNISNKKIYLNEC